MNKVIWSLINIRMNRKGLSRKILTGVLTVLLDLKGSFVGSGAKFLGKPIFPHGITGIFISSQAVIGKGCVIFHQVTIGSNTTPDSNKNGSPVIGANCYIGAGAKIIGKVTIGDNVRIGANCVVVKDVPNNSVVVNQPSRVIVKKTEQSNKFLNVNKI